MSQRSMYAKQDPKEIIDQFVSCPMTAEVVNAASMAFKTVLTERMKGTSPSRGCGGSRERQRVP